MNSQVTLLNQHQILSGWKEIANYMGMGVRTVQRYEAKFGLPVRRPSDRSRSLVIATKEEIDAWVHARPLARSFALPQTQSDGAALKTLKMALAEHHKLQEDLRKIREELHTSVEALKETMAMAQNMREEFKLTPSAEGKEYRKPN